jgi:hypothetical protein
MVEMLLVVADVSMLVKGFETGGNDEVVSKLVEVGRVVVLRTILIPVVECSEVAETNIS